MPSAVTLSIQRLSSPVPPPTRTFPPPVPEPFLSLLSAAAPLAVLLLAVAAALLLLLLLLRECDGGASSCELEVGLAELFLRLLLVMAPGSEPLFACCL
jgi:hypothetical protein